MTWLSDALASIAGKFLNIDPHKLRASLINREVSLEDVRLKEPDGMLISDDLKLTLHIAAIRFEWSWVNLLGDLGSQMLLRSDSNSSLNLETVKLQLDGLRVRLERLGQHQGRAKTADAAESSQPAQTTATGSASEDSITKQILNKLRDTFSLSLHDTLIEYVANGQTIAITLEELELGALESEGEGAPSVQRLSFQGLSSQMGTGSGASLALVEPVSCSDVQIVLESGHRFDGMWGVGINAHLTDVLVRVDTRRVSALSALLLGADATSTATAAGPPNLKRLPSYTECDQEIFFDAAEYSGPGSPRKSKLNQSLNLDEFFDCVEDQVSNQGRPAVSSVALVADAVAKLKARREKHKSTASMRVERSGLSLSLALENLSLVVGEVEILAGGLDFDGTIHRSSHTLIMKCSRGLTVKDSSLAQTREIALLAGSLELKSSVTASEPVKVQSTAATLTNPTLHLHTFHLSKLMREVQQILNQLPSHSVPMSEAATAASSTTTATALTKHELSFLIDGATQLRLCDDAENGTGQFMSIGITGLSFTQAIDNSIKASLQRLVCKQSSFDADLLVCIQECKFVAGTSCSPAFTCRKAAVKLRDLTSAADARKLFAAFMSALPVPRKRNSSAAPMVGVKVDDIQLVTIEPAYTLEISKCDWCAPEALGKLLHEFDRAKLAAQQEIEGASSSGEDMIRARARQRWQRPQLQRLVQHASGVLGGLWPSVLTGAAALALGVWIGRRMS